MSSRGRIAVIGIAGRFPGARSAADLWSNVVAGRESLTRFTAAELDDAGVPRYEYEHDDYVPVRGILDGAGEFDAGLFGFTPREAELTDPQHRVLLECAWEALESAGYPPRGRSVGVFAGTSYASYLWRYILRGGLEREVGLLPVLLANEKDHAATRIAYKLGLVGPALTVQTACSTSLAAVHLACQSIRRGECEMALAGGATIEFPQQSGYVYDRHGIASPDGHCRAFDVNARGTVAGNGAGLVLLKSLRQALSDGDEIHAVIAGSAMNNDGDRKAGYTAPSIAGQAEVIRMALEDAGVSADTIEYVETHGTGTELGDGIEIAALTEAFRKDTDRNGFCAVGSLKPNVGHLDAAAGIAGLIKAVMAVREGLLPPSINCTEPNPALRWETTPFSVNTSARPWPSRHGIRRSGVSSFGMGGTNVHVIIEEAPEPAAAPAEPEDRPELLIMSGQDAEAAREVVGRLAAYLTDSPGLAIGDVGRTLREGRAQLPWRAAAVGTSIAEGAREVARSTARRVTRTASPIFMFPGQGSQFAGMATELYDRLPVFRREVDECAAIVRSMLGVDLREHVCGAQGGPLDVDLTETVLAQPALFVVSYALAFQLKAWGIEPRVMLGHSVGELAAACLAGALSRDDALRLVVARGDAMQRAPGGAMVAVMASADDLSGYLGPEIDIAAVNSPHNTVLAGPHERVEELLAKLAAGNLRYQRLRVSHAFHSHLMEPAVARFHEAAARVAFRRPVGRVISTMTGAAMGTAAPFDAGYLSQQMRRPVRFSAALSAAVAAVPNPVLIEVGPGHALSALALQHELPGEPPVLATMMRPGEVGSAERRLLEAIGAGWSAGVPVDWTAFGRDRPGRRATLPTYPFRRQRYVLATPATGGVTVPPETADTATAATVAPVESAPPGREEIESEIAQLWTTLLGVDAPAADDNFFDLGGDSLTAVRLIAAVRRRFQANVGLTDVLQHASLRGQVDVVAHALDSTRPLP